MVVTAETAKEKWEVPAVTVFSLEEGVTVLAGCSTTKNTASEESYECGNGPNCSAGD